MLQKKTNQGSSGIKPTLPSGNQLRNLYKLNCPFRNNHASKNKLIFTTKKLSLSQEQWDMAYYIGHSRSALQGEHDVMRANNALHQNAAPFQPAA